MIKPVFIGLFFKEQIHPRPGEELHAHGVDLTGFKRWELILRNLKPPAFIHLKSMPRFMRQHIDIAGRAVKIRENKRRFVFANESAVPTTPFAWFGDKIHQFIFRHKTKKFIRLGRQFRIHLRPVLHDPLGVALWGRVSRLEGKTLVVIQQLLHIDPVLLPLLQLCGNRHNMLLHLVPEVCYLLSIIIRA
ncbi:hypothetical protein D3C81_1063940 [compost metagenome]